jgi:Na+-transporting methylmalonyl-CoA/oxaloacetate decarboxylase gamma subunit
MNTRLHFFRWFLFLVLLILAMWFLAVSEAAARDESGDSSSTDVVGRRSRVGRNMLLSRRAGRPFLRCVLQHDLKSVK